MCHLGSHLGFGRDAAYFDVAKPKVEKPINSFPVFVEPSGYTDRIAQG